MKHHHWLYVVIGVLVLYLGYSWYQTSSLGSSSAASS
jgi:uncharacterized membrane protein YczE